MGRHGIRAWGPGVLTSFFFLVSLGERAGDGPSMVYIIICLIWDLTLSPFQNAFVGAGGHNAMQMLAVSAAIPALVGMCSCVPGRT